LENIEIVGTPLERVKTKFVSATATKRKRHVRNK
jgi:hypothetical protein